MNDNNDNDNTTVQQIKIKTKDEIFLEKIMAVPLKNNTEIEMEPIDDIEKKNILDKLDVLSN